MEDHVLLLDMCAHTRTESGCSSRTALVPFKADSLQGQPLTPALTAPLRLVLPGKDCNSESPSDCFAFIGSTQSALRRGW